jgi:hypothetical protein
MLESLLCLFTLREVAVRAWAVWDVAIFLLNGQRTSGYQDIGSLPPEAIDKVEVLPEPAALKFGYPPSRRVVNFITKRRFSQTEARATFGAAMDGVISPTTAGWPMRVSIAPPAFVRNKTPPMATISHNASVIAPAGSASGAFNERPRPLGRCSLPVLPRSRR